MYFRQRLTHILILDQAAIFFKLLLQVFLEQFLQLNFIGKNLRRSLLIVFLKKKAEVKIMIKAKLPSSFRDPSGFLFFRNGSLYRQVNTIYKENYDCLIDSGLYEALINAELLIPHNEVDIERPNIR